MTSFTIKKLHVYISKTTVLVYFQLLIYYSSKVVSLHFYCNLTVSKLQKHNTVCPIIQDFNRSFTIFQSHVYSRFYYS